MVQRREQSRFTFETRQTIRVRGEPRRQDLDRHVASELLVARPVHLAHATRAQRLHDLVRSEAIAALQRPIS